MARSMPAMWQSDIAMHDMWSEHAALKVLSVTKLHAVLAALFSLLILLPDFYSYGRIAMSLRSVRTDE